MSSHTNSNALAEKLQSRDATREPLWVRYLLLTIALLFFVENIFDSRYRHVPEMVRMGADIRLEGRVAVVCGVDRLHGAAVRAKELRGGASLVLAGILSRQAEELQRPKPDWGTEIRP